ncbi:hypothetical protein BHM03_00032592 [Ensete ventricosum]|nr:hypothetical protein BHM03_00032592 [Ensete ventricosum]
MYADQNRTGFLGRSDFFNCLKLVTVAQSGRQLTPEIVKSALFGPAAAKIPAPKINLASSPAAQSNSGTTPTVPTNSLQPPTNQNLGFRPTQAPRNSFMNQQFFPTATSNVMRPPQVTRPAASTPVQGGISGLVGGGSVAGQRLLSSNNSNLSNNWHGGNSNVLSVGGASQTPIRGTIPSQNQESFSLGLLGMSGPKLDSNTLGFSVNSISNSSSTALMAVGTQSSIRPGQLDPSQITRSLPSAGSQLQQTQSNVKQNQLDNLKMNSALASPNVTAGSVNPASNQSQIQWPKITQADIKKYTNVFVNVDKDGDGKITGEQTRTLFLSWKLPREVLKQVWDLSDQDNDSMLSLREFCIALYLMERYREGHPLPSVLPSAIMYDETLLRAAGMPSAAYGVPTWQPGLPQQGLPGYRPVMPTAGPRPPMQTPVPSQIPGAMHSAQQNLGKPGLDNHMVNNFGKDEQHTMTPKYEESTNADNKVISLFLIEEID